MKSLLSLLFFLAFAAHAVENVKVMRGKPEIVKFLERIPAKQGTLDAAIYNTGEQVTMLQTSTPSKDDLKDDPVNNKAGDRFIDISLRGDPSPDCNYGATASFILRKGKYLPQDRTANWFQNHICKAPNP